MNLVNTPNNIISNTDYLNLNINTHFNSGLIHQSATNYTSKTTTTYSPQALTTDLAINTNQLWLKHSSVGNQAELSAKYADICQQHKQEKKWILFINAEDSSLEQLAKNHGVDVSKVLCVSFKGKNKLNNMLNEHSAHLNIEQLKKVLSQGNCSAVILSNASFDSQQISALDDSARQGKTHCVLLKNTKVTEYLVNKRYAH